MKITKKQLRRMIREEIETLEYPADKNVDNVIIDFDFPEDVEATEDAWAGGPTVLNQIDHAKAVGADPTTRGQEILKINESPITKPGAQWEKRLVLRDLDNDQPYSTRTTVIGDMVTIEFGNSFTLHLDKIDASDLGQDLLDAADWADPPKG